MVKHVHVSLDESDYDSIKAVKDDHDLTWEELLINGAHALDTLK